MTRARKALALVVMATLGLWGCAQDQNPSTRTAKIKALESKYTKLEDDFRSVVAARDQNLVKLIRYRLELGGYEVASAHDAERAMQLAVERRPDICVLDASIP